MKKSGFTLIEVLVSLSIFGIAALALGQAYSTHLSFNTLSEARTGGIAAVTRVLDQLRVQDPATLPATGTDADRSIVIGQRTFLVSISYCSPTTYCTSNNIRQIHATAKLHGSIVYAVDTIFAQLR